MVLASNVVDEISMRKPRVMPKPLETEGSPQGSKEGMLRSLQSVVFVS